MNEAKNVVFVRLEDPDGKRKAVLGSAITIIEVLKGYEKLRRLRREKGLAKRELKMIFKDIKRLLEELEEIMPTLKITEEIPKKQEVQNVAREKPAKVAIKTEAERNKEYRMTKLEKDLEELKNKISGI